LKAKLAALLLTRLQVWLLRKLQAPFVSVSIRMEFMYTSDKGDTVM
jgi:hypothetical protein